MRASKLVGGLVILTGISGFILLSLDIVLRSGAPTHFYALAFFVLVDIGVGVFVLAKPTKLAYTMVIGWSLLRIILQFADVSQASAYQFSSYAQFADYLFNPASAVSASLGNPPGVPGALIDVIVILEIVALVLAWNARSGKN